METGQNNFIIKPNKNDPSRVDLSWSYQIIMRIYPSGRTVCFIPSFRLRFSAKSIEHGKEKSKVVTRLFVRHFVSHFDNKGVPTLKHLTDQLHYLGFTTPMEDLVRMKINKGHKLDKTAKYKHFDIAPDGLPDQYTSKVDADMENLVANMN